jgi:hypothetical protein
MSTDREICFSDLTRAVETRDPQLADLVVRYLELPDPPENAPEEPPTSEEGAPGSAPQAPPLPGDAWTLQRLRGATSATALQHKTGSEKKAARREAWDALLAAPHPPPRLRLGALFVELYESGEESARDALREVFRRGRLGLGIWQAFKRIYKLAEERHDLATFGLLAWRLDAMSSTPTAAGEIGGGTLLYMRRRAWRYLRHLGQATPALFPQFACEVLRHYPRGHRFSGSWIANQIWAHKDLIRATGAWMDRPGDLKKRAFDDAWKQSADPLLSLLEDAQNDVVCDFAIRCLRQDFPETLRSVDPRWLARLGRKPLASVHDFIVKTLSESPEFHQSKLRGLGLHETVLALLLSESAGARKYAVEYAQSHAGDMPVEELVRLVFEGAKEAKDFAAARLAARGARELGLPALCRLLGVGETAEMARTKITEGFTPADLDAALFVTLAAGNQTQNKFVVDFFNAAKRAIPAGHYRALLEDKRCNWNLRRWALGELAKRSGSEIGVDWIKTTLMDPQLGSTIADWLRKGMLKGDELDVEWVKGLVMRPALRPLAIELLGNRALVAPNRVGLAWLLAMARQPDDALSKFAQRYLLEHFTPEDFAQELGRSDPEAGIERLWTLASGAKEPEQVRGFAATYLQLHHPELGPTQPEARSLGIKPRLPRESYTLARVRPLFADARADVRRLAAAIGRRELLRWQEPALLYELADSAHREPRGLAAAALLAIGQPEADPATTPPAGWLDAGRVFALAESPVKATREVALTLIRRHYATLGSPVRLAWLMESPEREVRLFAVRLLWEKHRPRETPATWTPPRGQAIAVAPDRFDSAAALQGFLRGVLFGLPPGRLERREGSGDALPDRPLAASVAKRRLVGVVSELALEDAEFARVAVPVLEEFTRSRAKGEWQGCVAALAKLRRAHPRLPIALPPGRIGEARDTTRTL